MSTETIITIRQAAESIAAAYGHQVCDVITWMDINPAWGDVQSFGYDAQGLEELYDAYAADMGRITDEHA